MGLIQGITEFLPVSSSGHLVLFSRMTGAESNLFFDLIVHCATLLAIVIVCFKDIAEAVRHPLSKRTRLLLLATLVTAAVAFCLKDLAALVFDGRALWWCFLITAGVLIAGGLLPKQLKHPAAPMGYLDAAIIGGLQGIAVFPGLSRSGLTLSTAGLLGVKKDEGVPFCFLISIPVILGSTLLELIGGSFTRIGILPLLVGFAAAFLSGFAALKLLTKFLKSSSLTGFSVYLLLLSLFLLLNDTVFMLF